MVRVLSKNYLENKDYRFSLFCLSLLIISAFGPYLSTTSEIRFDHLIIYSLLTVTLFREVTFSNNFLKVDIPLFLILVLLLAILLWSSLVTLFMDSFLSITSIVSDFENLFQPVAIFLISYLLLKDLNKSQLNEITRKIIITFIFLLGINTLVMLQGIFFGYQDYFDYFTGTSRGFSNHNGEDNLLSLSLLGGRSGGVFVQAYEAGMAYALGLLCFIYIIKDDYIKPSLLTFLTFTLLILGGILSGSKVFIFSLFGIVPFYLGFSGMTKLLFNKNFLMICLVITALIFYFLDLYSRGEVITEVSLIKVLGHSMKFLEGKNIPILFELIFNSRSDYIINIVGKILETYPLHGYGLGSLQTSDSGLIYYMWTGGLVSLVLSLCIFIIIFIKAITAMLSSRAKDGSFLFFSWIVILFACYAGPILVANRVAIFIWFFVVLFFFRLNKLQENYI